MDRSKVLAWERIIQANPVDGSILYLIVLLNEPEVPSDLSDDDNQSDDEETPFYIV